MSAFITKPRSITVYDLPNGGGSHTVSILETLDDGRVRVRIWYGRATALGWERWRDWDGGTQTVQPEDLRNKRTMNLFKTAS